MATDMLNRREAIAASGLALVAAGGESRAAEAAEAIRTPPLASDFTIAARIPTPDFYIHDPGMTVLPSGRIFVAAPIRRRREAEIPSEGPGPQATSVLLARGDDRGDSWESLPTLSEYRDATPFVHGGVLYLLIPHYAEGQLLLMRERG